MGNREQVLSDCKLMLAMLTDYSKLDAEIDKANKEIVVVSEMVTTCIRENATKALSQEGVQGSVRQSGQAISEGRGKARKAECGES